MTNNRISAMKLEVSFVQRPALHDCVRLNGFGVLAPARADHRAQPFAI